MVKVFYQMLKGGGRWVFDLKDHYGVLFKFYCLNFCAHILWCHHFIVSRHTIFVIHLVYSLDFITKCLYFILLINKVHVSRLNLKNDMCTLVCHKGESQSIEFKGIMLMMWQ